MFNLSAFRWDLPYFSGETSANHGHETDMEISCPNTTMMDNLGTFAIVFPPYLSSTREGTADIILADTIPACHHCIICCFSGLGIEVS